MKFFVENVGKTDKIIRTIIGIIGLFGSLFLSAPWSYASAIIGAILILTAIFGTCGLYSLLGINTNKNSKNILKEEEPKNKKKSIKKKKK